MRRFPLAAEAKSGKSSFRLVTRVRSEVEKKKSCAQATATRTRYKAERKNFAEDYAEIDELIATVFGTRGASP